jgi:uracil-DNA glycosylase
MRPSTKVKCNQFPCSDVRHECYIVPDVDIHPDKVSVVLIAEAAPPELKDYYYSKGTPLFQETTVQAFRDAGVDVSSVRDILRLGVYLTTAVKCGKRGYGLQTGTIKECSLLLVQELAQFQNVRAYLLMGDVAIKAINAIAARSGEGRVIPAGSTYKIRGGRFTFHGARAFPSYLQAGPSFFIEKTKRTMIAQDIKKAMTLAK